MSGLEQIVTTINKKIINYSIKNPIKISLIKGSLLELAGSSLLEYISQYTDYQGPILIYHGTLLGISGFYAKSVYDKAKTLEIIQKINISRSDLKSFVKQKISNECEHSSVQSVNNKFKFTNISDAIFNHKNKVSAGLALTIVGTTLYPGFTENLANLGQEPDLMNYFNLIVSDSNILKRTGFYLGMMFTSLNVIFRGLDLLFNSKNLSFVNSDFRTLYSNNFLTGKKKLVYLQKTMLKYPTKENSYRYAIELSKQDLFAKSTEEVLKTFEKKHLSIESFSVFYTSLLGANHVLEDYLSDAFKQSKSKHGIVPGSFMLASMLDYIGRPKQSLNVIKDLSKKTSSSYNAGQKLELDLAQAVFFKTTGRTNLYRDKMLELMDSKVFSLQRIGSYNAALIGFSKATKQSIVLKPSLNKEDVISERRYNHDARVLFNEMNDISRNKVIDDPELITHANKHFSSIIFRSGHNLYDYLNLSNDFSRMKEIGLFLGQLHASNGFFEPMPISHYKSELDKRLFASESLFSEEIAIIHDNYDLLFEGFNKFYRVKDFDSHRHNWIISNINVKIDNQFRIPTLPFYEASKLYEQGKYGGVDAASIADFKDKSLRIYHSELENVKSQMPYEEFYFHKLKSDVIKGLSFFFYARGDAYKQGLAGEMLDNVLVSMTNLEPRYILSSQQRQIKNLKHAVFKLRVKN